MKIYDQLCVIAQNAGAPFLQHHSEDLFEIDREQLLFDSQQGSNYIWVLKSNGCGTWFFSACDDNKWRESIISDDDRCFHISCTNQNQGTVNEIHSVSEFNQLCSHYDKQTKSLKPRRTSLLAALGETLGINFSAMSDSLFCTEFNPRPGDISNLEFSIIDSFCKIDVYRRVMKNNTQNDIRTLKKRATYHLPLSFKIETDILLAGGKLSIEVATTQQSYAELTII